MEYSGPNYNEDFDGKVAIVTGGASGIGRGVVEGLAYHGAKVALFDIDMDKSLRDVVNPLMREGLEVFPYRVDVSKRDSVERTVKDVVERVGVPWILVNNAGIEVNDKGNLWEMPYEDGNRIIKTNLYGYWHMLRSVVPHMIKNDGGRIVNISSVQAIQSCKPGTTYQATKQAILGLSRSAAIEGAGYNVRVNSVIPGKIKTEGMGKTRLDEDPRALDDLLRSTPMGRGGHSKEVTDAVLYLLSENSSYITGAELVVDGGLLTTLIGDQEVPNPPVQNDPDRS